MVVDDEAEGDATISINKKKFREEDLPALALDAIAKSPELMDRIFKATGWSVCKSLRRRQGDDNRSYRRHSNGSI